MRTKYYFRTEDSERCHPAEYFHSDMKDEGMTEMEVFEAKPYRIADAIWCKAVDEITQKDEYTCGKVCEDYEPCNGKSGMCRFNGQFYEPDKKVTLTLKNNGKCRK